MSNFHEDRTSDDMLAVEGFARGLDQYLHLNRSQKGQRPSKKSMATTVEALVRAVFIDSEKSFSKARNTIIALGILEPE